MPYQGESAFWLEKNSLPAQSNQIERHESRPGVPVTEQASFVEKWGFSFV